MRYGGKNIQMTADEVNHIRACGQDTNFMRLLGFRYTRQFNGNSTGKKMSQRFDQHHNLKH